MRSCVRTHWSIATQLDSCTEVPERSLACFGFSNQNVKISKLLAIQLITSDDYKADFISKH